MVRERLVLCVLAVILAIFVLVGAAAVLPVRVVVNGKPIISAVGWTRENGQLHGPIAPVVNALGASTTYLPASHTFAINTPDIWVHLGREPGGTTLTPYQTAGLAPVLVVRHRLAEEQWTAFQAVDPTAPLLARYEVVDVANLDLVAFDIDAGPKGDVGYSVVAYQYWALPDISRDVPRTGARLLKTTAPHTQSYTMQGPRFSTIRIDTVNYTVAPLAVARRQPRDVKDTADTRHDALIQGATGWTISRTILVTSRTIPATPEALATLDLSMQQVPGAMK